LVISIYGEEKTGEMLIFSQVILSLQLGFAIIPLIHFVSDKAKMGEFAIKPYVQIASWLIALIIVSLNVKLVYDEMVGWLTSAGDQAYILWLTAIPVALASFVLLLYITFGPLLKRKTVSKHKSPHGAFKPLVFAEETAYKKIAIAIDFSDMDSKAINSAISQGGKSAEYILIHVVESAGAWLMGREVSDLESELDGKNLQKYVNQLTEEGYSVTLQLGYGIPKQKIPKIVEEFDADLLVMGAHGHQWFKDIIFGTTVDGVRHRLKIPVFIIREK
jgi:manganese transport protein